MSRRGQSGPDLVETAEPPTMREVALALHVALVEVGFPRHALPKVGSVLLSASRRRGDGDCKERGGGV